MRKLPRPIDNPGDVFTDCIELIRNANLKTRLAAAKELIVEASNEFEEKATTTQLYTINRETIINVNLTAKELELVYTNRMAKKGAPGRKHYDKLIISSPNGICPLCSHREVTTLDHHLPKAEYPRLSIVPINLIPACSDCNKSKLVDFPTRPEEETLHPYFDNIEDDLWLTATVNQTTPPTIIFNVTPPAVWEKLLADRVKFHFESLLLSKLYSTQAAVELVQINLSLNKLHIASGLEGVRQYLLEAAESRNHANINSWQAAMYNAVAADNWFCDGGFRLLPF